jgi:protein MpaA
MRRLPAVLVAALAVVLATPATAAVEQVPPAPRIERLGRSVEGRPINVVRLGDPAAPRKVLVIGCIHGDEPEGRKIVDLLRTATPPPGVELLLVRNLNPDGFQRHTRQNAHGVDLNRNFPWRWRPGPHGTYYPGPRAGSEPETRALMRLVRRVRPQLAIYYHQHLGVTVRARGADPAVQREYARRTGLPLRSLPDYRGTAVGWENHAVPAGSAFVVELRAGPAPAARHADAVLALARRYLPTP